MASASRVQGFGRQVVHAVTFTRGCRVARWLAAGLVTLLGPAAFADGALAKGGRPSGAPAASAVVRISSGGEEISTIHTARGVTTMISLPEEAREAVCGDLFDPATGQGGFVLQRSGRDLFLKPLRGSGRSNLFLKTDRATYAFELEVVPAARAMRIVYVDVAAPLLAVEVERDRLANERRKIEADREAFVRERKTALGEIERLREEIGESMAGQSRDLANRIVADGLRDPGSVIRLSKTAGRAGALDVTLGDSMVVLGGRAYLRCVLRNRSKESVTIASARFDPVEAAVDVTVAAGGVTSFVLQFPGMPNRRGVLRLLDSKGAEAVRLAPW